MEVLNEWRCVEVNRSCVTMAAADAVLTGMEPLPEASLELALTTISEGAMLMSVVAAKGVPKYWLEWTAESQLLDLRTDQKLPAYWDEAYQFQDS